MGTSNSTKLLRQYHCFEKSGKQTKPFPKPPATEEEEPEEETVSPFDDADWGDGDGNDGDPDPGDAASVAAVAANYPNACSNE